MRVRQTRSRQLAIAAVAGSSVLLAACSSQSAPENPEITDPQPSATPADNAYQLPDRYAVTVRSHCGERGFLGSYRVWVEAGEAVRVRHAGRPRSVLPLQAAPSLEGMQEIARQARARGADSVEVAYAPHGRLIGLDIDYIAEAIDDELCYDTADFTSLVEPSVP